MGPDPQTRVLWGPCILSNLMMKVGFWRVPGCPGGGGGEEGGHSWSSDHGPVGALHLKELNDERGPPCHDLGGQVAERTVLDAHDGQLAAQCQLEGQAVQVGVVVQVQLLQVLQGACRGDTAGSPVEVLCPLGGQNKMQYMPKCGCEVIFFKCI